MDGLKKIIGVIAMGIGIAAEWWLIQALMIDAASDKNPFGKTAEAVNIAKWTLIPVSIPVILGGLLIFGFYALKGEYEGSQE